MLDLIELGMFGPEYPKNKRFEHIFRGMVIGAISMLATSTSCNKLLRPIIQCTLDSDVWGERDSELQLM